MTDFAELGIRADSRELVTARQEMRALADEGQKTERTIVRGSDAIMARWRTMARVAGAAAGALAATFGAGSVMREAEAYETRMARVNAILQATGGVAGRTADQLETQARALARASLESVDGIMNAQQVLLTFRNVQGDVFDRAIELSADLAAAMGQDVVGATRQLARALEDPISGITALTRSGTVFTQQQREQIRTMVEAGNVLGAQVMILDELAAQYGGAATAGSRLAMAKDGLAQSFSELRLAINGATGISDLWARALEALDGLVQSAAENMDRFRGYILAAGIAVTAYYTPALFAATVQTGLWVGSLVTLKGALIATGIGAFIVLAGTMINYLLQLVENTGGWGESLTLLGDVAAGVWQGIRTAAEALLPALSAVWSGIKASFLSALADMAEGFSDWLGGFAVLGNIPEIGPLAPLAVLGRAAGAHSQTVASGLRDSAVIAEADSNIFWGQAQNAITTGFDEAAEAAGRLLEAVRGVGEFAPADLESVTQEAEALQSVLEAVGDTHEAAGGRAAAAARDILPPMEEINLAAQRVESSFESAFVNFVTGAQNARQAVSSLLGDLARLAAQSAFQSLFVGSGPLVGNVIPFADGGVVNRPTMFPMSGNRTGLMGEAGPEAIMPLRRGRDGKLGVAAPPQEVAVDVRVHVDEGGNWKANVERIADGRVRKQAPGIVRQSVQATYAANSERRMT